ncbi:MAG TPA: XTP/dITP diphosphatase [Desulfonatronum sp.]|nr:XTP/dITP diphosphatase [Desulfonatronum sp.]
MLELVLATRNRGKAVEIASLLRDFHVQVNTLEAFPDIEEIPETGSTFAENALIKARTVARATGLISLADDSGLEVAALNGAPGVYSARFNGFGSTDEQNNAKLLRLMADVPWQDRQARFVCVIAVHAPQYGGRELVAKGSWSGRIAMTMIGTNGFGYDPLFLDEELGLTAAQMEPEQKNARSHRAAALRELEKSWPIFIKNITGHLDFSGPGMHLPEDGP